MKKELDTYYAPAKRKSLEEIREEIKEIFNTNFEEILNMIPNMVLIVNEERQAVFLNQKIIQMLGIKNIEEAMGSRPGEIFNCIHSKDFIHGCGTGQACRYCGAVNAVLESLKTNKRISCESRITSNFKGNLISFDLNIIAQPFNLMNKVFVMVFLSDISNLKRRELLEKTFLHDLINLLTVVKGLIELFPIEGLNSTQNEYFSRIKKSIHIMVEEFLTQRDLIAAENSELIIDLKNHYSLDILQSTIDLMNSKDIIKDKLVELDNNSTSVMFQTDSSLLSRILINLIENALEASKPGETVKIGTRITNQKITFRVENSGVMTESVKSQIFQRSFSTKGPGRGIGTYSVKLLTERYLGGHVDFQSTKKEGTTFYVHLPLNKKS
ncbi:MAG: PAS domain-containing sensor histidine kinase [Promethearchaeota archaeon]